MHVIRLRGPWDVSSDGSRITYSRRFGRPRSLDAGERVWLVCSHLPGPATVHLNDELLGQTSGAGPVALDMTDQLQLRNAVVFAVDGCGELGEVAVEIRDQ